MSENYNQSVITGEMIFYSYEEYNFFKKFINQYPLKIYYKTDAENDWLKKECQVTVLDKTEKEDTGRLICLIEFTATTMWYKDITVQKTDTTLTVGKKYPYKYNYTYRNSTDGILKILNSGDIESPCKISIYGLIENPKWSLIQNGEIIGTGAINAVIEENTKLVINTENQNMEIGLYTLENEFIQDMISFSDFSTQRFLQIPVGESKLQITGISLLPIDAVIEIKKLYN